jgi:hypothetical protein
MNWESFFNNIALLEVIRFVVFSSMFLFSASYLIPQGIIYFMKWKETKQFSKLSTSMAFLSGAIFILIYFLVMFIFDSIKKAL